MADVGPLNARIHDGMIQFAAPLNLNVFTIMGTLVVQADGAFVKRGGTFVYEPDTLYVGGCPVGRIPFAKDYVMGKVLFAKPISDDLAAAWSKLVSRPDRWQHAAPEDAVGRGLAACRRASRASGSSRS